MLRTLRPRWLTPLGVCAATGDGMRYSPLDMASSLVNGVARCRSGAGLARLWRHQRARPVSPDLTASHDHVKAARRRGDASVVVTCYVVRPYPPTYSNKQREDVTGR